LTNKFARTGASITTAVSLLALCACNSTAGSLVTSTQPAARHDARGWFSPRAKRPDLVYVANHSTSTIDIFTQGANPQPVGQITDGIDGPSGIAVDRNGTLYVANSLGNTVTEYPAGATSPSVTLTNPIENPNAVAIDSTGRVYVSEGTSGEVISFPAGSAKPDRTIKKLANPDGMDVDARDRLVATYSAFPPSGVDICPLHSHCRQLPLRTRLAADTRVDLKGNIIVADDDVAVIDVFKRSRSTPIRTIDVTNGTPLALSLDAQDKLLYVADEPNGGIDEIDYQSGQLVRLLPDEGAWGVALYPGQKPGP
jgi:DNA-binding beta-propeller fold protein YncE